MFANGAVTAAFGYLFNELQHGQRKSLRNTPAELEMLESGNVLGYYESRLSRGDFYAATAIDVVKNQGSLGKSANAWLFTNVAALSVDAQQQLLNGGSYIEFVRSVNIGLAQQHSIAVDLDSVRIPGLLSATQITVYHEAYFVGRGLPATTFGGSALFGAIPPSYWCRGCDSAP